MSNQQDEFSLESGLKDDYDGDIVDAWFAAADIQYGGNTQLFLKIAAADGEEVENRYGVGSDWASFDGGETIEHPKDTSEHPRKFNNQTAIGELMSAAFKVGAEKTLRDRSQQLYSGKGMRVAALWKGLRFHWGVKTETRRIKDRDTQEMREVTMNRALPTAFHGESGTPAPAAADNQPGQTADAAVPSPTPSGNPLDGLTAEDSAKVKVLSKTLPYHEWVDKVMELPNAIANDTLMAALGDEVLYNQLKEG